MHLEQPLRLPIGRCLSIIKSATFVSVSCLSLLSATRSPWVSDSGGDNLVMSRILGQTPQQPVSRGGEQVILAQRVPAGGGDAREGGREPCECV